ncbi:MAG: hypothetical protein K2Q03_06335, partial [Sphingobacteriaceae bacterium]|nr:hypothetical protein [Sphingobacteriaceae bacterium]
MIENKELTTELINERKMNKLEGIETIIKEESKRISDNFAEIFKKGIVEKFSFTIDQNKLDSKYLNKVNITLDGDFSAHLQDMIRYEEHPALYFFEINESIEKDDIINLINKTNEINQLNIPAKNYSTTNEGVLYVGKVK